jgi:hypothetical protein
MENLCKLNRISWDFDYTAVCLQAKGDGEIRGER